MKCKLLSFQKSEIIYKNRPSIMLKVFDNSKSGGVEISKDKFNSTLSKEVNEVLAPALNSIEMTLQSK